MRLFYLTLWILLIPYTFVVAQQGNINSLKDQLSSAKGKNRVDLLNTLSKQLISRDYDQGAEYADEAYHLSEDLGYTRGLINSAYFLGIYNRDQGKFGRADRYTDEGIEAAKSIGDQEQELQGYKILITIHQVAHNQKRQAEAEIKYNQLKNKIDLAERSQQLEELKDEYTAKEKALLETESEKREIEDAKEQIEDKLNLTVEEKLRKEAELAQLAKEKALLETESEKREIEDAKEQIEDKLNLTVEEKLRKEAELAQLAKEKAELELQTLELENERTRDSLEISQKEKEILEYNAKIKQQQFNLTLTIIGLVVAALFSFILIRYYRLKRKSAEEKIKTQRQMMMQEKMATLGQLTAGIAHEIKNPLNFVNNFAEGSAELADELKETINEYKGNLKTDQYDLLLELAEDLRQNSLDISQNGKRADRIVHSMMEHARGESGQRQDVDVNHLLRENIHFSYQGFKGFAPDYVVEIEENYASDLPALSVIPQDFSRVLLNILNNAHYALYEKKQQQGDDFTPILKVNTATSNGNVVIRIRDNGPGIPDDVKGKVFNPFFTTKPTGLGNTGLGLSISYDIIVQVHEGKLEVNTEPGEYTEFIISIPIKN